MELLVNMAFFKSFFTPFINAALFTGFEDLELLYEAILVVIFILGPIFFVIGLAYIMFPGVRSIFGGS